MSRAERSERARQRWGDVAALALEAERAGKCAGCGDPIPSPGGSLCTTCRAMVARLDPTTDEERAG